MPSSSSRLSAPSLYDDDDIVNIHRHRHSSSGSRGSSGSSRSSGSSSSSHHHHHHHHHDSANARLQGNTDRYASVDHAVQRLYRWIVQSIIILVLASACTVLWMRNKMLSDDLANYTGTNEVLVEQNSKYEAEQKNLLLQIQALENDKAELENRMNALLKSRDESSQGADQ